MNTLTHLKVDDLAQAINSAKRIQQDEQSQINSNKTNHSFSTLASSVTLENSLQSLSILKTETTYNQSVYNTSANSLIFSQTTLLKPFYRTNLFIVFLLSVAILVLLSISLQASLTGKMPFALIACSIQLVPLWAISILLLKTINQSIYASPNQLMQMLSLNVAAAIGIFGISYYLSGNSSLHYMQPQILFAYLVHYAIYANYLRYSPKVKAAFGGNADC